MRAQKETSSRFSRPLAFLVHTVVVPSGGDKGKENMSGIGRCHWVKSRKSCLREGKPYTCLIHSVTVVLECHYFLL